MNQTVTINTDAEIDLVELLLVIWRKKWLVVLLVAIFSGLGTLYALYAKEQWTSKAEIIVPRNHDIANILQKYSAYARIVDEPESNKDDLSKKLFYFLMTELRSINTRVDFFKQSVLYQQLTEGFETEAQKQPVLRQLVNHNTSIQWPNEKKGITYPTIAFSAESPEMAQQTLMAYIEHLNQIAIRLERENFLLQINSKISSLSFDLAQIEERLPLERKIRLEIQQKNLEHALATAKAAGIKEYVKKEADEIVVISELTLSEADRKLPNKQLSDNNVLFLMGEKYLTAQLDNIDKAPLVFPVKYHTKKKQLLMLNELLAEQTSDISDHSFYYQSAPYLPLERDKPRRGLIVLISALLGGIIGVLWVLTTTAIAARKQPS